MTTTAEQCQDMSTPEAREAAYKMYWEQAAAAGNKAREMLLRVITQGLTLPLERDIRNLIGPYAQLSTPPADPLSAIKAAHSAGKTIQSKRPSTCYDRQIERLTAALRPFADKFAITTMPTIIDQDALLYVEFPLRDFIRAREAVNLGGAS